MPYLWNTELFCFSKKNLFFFCTLSFRQRRWWQILFTSNDDLSPLEMTGGVDFFTVEVTGWVMPKSDGSDDDNIAPVEVAGGVMPKRALWLVLGPDNDDENDWKLRWITMMKIIMKGDEWLWWWFWCLTVIFYLTRQCRRQKTLFLDNWRRSPGILWLPACFLHWLKWFCLFCFDHNSKVWFWTLGRRGWDSPVQGRSNHGEKVPSGSVLEIRLVYVYFKA